MFEKYDNYAQLPNENTKEEICIDNRITKNRNEYDIRSNSAYDNIKPNVASVGVTTSNRNDIDASNNSSDSQETKDECATQSDYSTRSDSDSSNNSLLSKLGYSLNVDVECSETDSSPITSSDDIMTSLDSGVRTVIYESAGSNEFDSTQNGANPDINKNDNVKTTTKSSCILA
ncbi:unnamed protein product [Parnassius apollo]|uniref:(apollo) hypothetical protein n=1 Tax=Parnassius apollo TaxID=110799 RepID=A0A8S3YAK7_PARAO|nr:unnamed protein product [Parnassius apollo]